jgi:hypothetical protein
MSDSKSDAGTIAALMDRFQNARIPRAQRLLEQVNRGEKLSDYDISFLKRVFDDGRNIRSLVERNPEYLSLVSRFVDLYTEIVAKALENERAP